MLEQPLEALTRFVRDAFHLPDTADERAERLEEALITLDLERRRRLQKEWGDDVEGHRSGRSPEQRFAGMMLIIIGVFDAIQGLVALFNDEFYVVAEKWVFEFDITA
jgi:hypothetical protein